MFREYSKSFQHLSTHLYPLTEKCIFYSEIDNNLNQMLTVFFRKTLPMADKRYQTFTEIEMELTEMIDCLECVCS